MSLTGFKKQINKANQLLNEKVGTAKGTELEEEYIDTEKRVDLCKSLFDELLNKLTEFLQPNPSYRAKLMTMNALHKMAGKSNQKALYPQPENQLSEIFNKYGKDLKSTTFGSCLMETSESFKDMADIKYALEDQIKQNFVEPITKIQETDLKEIMMHRKKVQSRRLDYDCKKRNKDKGSKISDEEVRMAEEKFEESKSLAVDAMNNFLDSEGEHINALAEFIKAEMEYHSRTAEILESLYNSILEKNEESINKPPSSRKMSTAKKYSISDTHSINSEHDNSEQIAKISIKKKHDSSQSTPKIPTCRALYDFVAENPMELQFNEGDIIKLIQQVDDSWFEGELDNKKGFFPINYVEVLIPLSE